VTYNDAIIRQDGTGRGRRHGHGDVWKKNRVTANGGGVVESRAGIYYYYNMYGNRRASPKLCKQNKRLCRQSLSRVTRRRGTRVQYYILY